MLDRAINVSARNAPTLAAIFAVYEIPMLVLTLRNGHLVSVYTELAARFGLAESLNRPDFAHSMATLAIALALKFVLGPLVAVFLIISIASFYLTGGSSIVEAYRVTKSVAITTLAIAFLYEIPTCFAYFATFEAATAFPLVSNLERIVILSVTLGGLFCQGALMFAGGITVCAVALEGARGRRAIWKTLRRLGDRNRLVRSFGALGVALILWLGTAAIRSAFWTLLPMHFIANALAISGLSSLAELVGCIVLSAFIVVFYYDIRIREEAFDLHAAVDAIAQRTASVATL
jgi:hypothetical protein